MERIIINGGNKLNGDLEIGGAKNALLPILAACLLCKDEIVLHNCPNLSDVNNTIQLLKQIGAQVNFSNNTIIINTTGVNSNTLPKEICLKMRSSIFLLGPMIARFKSAIAHFPGGCEIGQRPIDLHLKGLEKLNIDVIEEYGKIICKTDKIIGSEIVFDYPSVGATENCMMAAVLAKGTTIIHNAAREPEILDLQNFLNTIGAKISGAGSNKIVIEGVKKLHGASFRVMEDRIVTGTYLVAGAICGGDIHLKNVNSIHISSVISKMREAGCDIKTYKNSIRLKQNSTLKEINSIVTAPFPGFPTDMQSQMCAMCCFAKGTSVIMENVFENRFKQISELVKMGANISIKDRVAIIRGTQNLYGTTVEAKDLRGGASLVLAGIGAKGITVIENVHHIYRGYENICKDLNHLGAELTKDNVEEEFSESKEKILC